MLLLFFLAFLGFGVAFAMDFFLNPGRDGLPSLESFGNIIVYGLMVHIVRKTVQGEILRVVFISLPVFLTLLAGFSRIYLDATVLPDVLAGSVAGFGWLVFSILLVKSLRQIRTKG